MAKHKEGFTTGGDALARHLGIELVEVKPGYAMATMVAKPELLNDMGLTHDGAIFALADTTFGAACNAGASVALALDINISFIKAANAGEMLTAVAREENLTAQNGLYRMEVKNVNNEMVALAHGRFLRL
ncbi:MAG: hotdog fold thioesterase [Syntrophomonadaceae bacterium]